jgi:putative flippase GtrA
MITYIMATIVSFCTYRRYTAHPKRWQRRVSKYKHFVSQSKILKIGIIGIIGVVFVGVIADSMWSLVVVYHHTLIGRLAEKIGEVTAVRFLLGIVFGAIVAYVVERGVLFSDSLPKAGARKGSTNQPAAPTGSASQNSSASVDGEDSAARGDGKGRVPSIVVRRRDFGTCSHCPLCR